jgi:hypothetical protein
MSGKRAKRLRAQFLAHYDRYPKRTRISTEVIADKHKQVLGVKLPGNSYTESWAEKTINGIVRQVKERKAVLRALFTVTVKQPSEWRRWKKERGNVEAFEVRMGWRDRLTPDAAILPATEMPEAA